MVARVFLCAFAAASVLNAADLPYAGKWKMNPAKSDFGGTTFTYTSLPSGEWEYSADGQTYKFRMDQKDYPDGMGSTASWKPLDAATWQTVWKLNGKLLFTDTLKLTADSKNLTINTKGTKPNGNPIDTTTTAQRISGGPGLAGKWKTSNVKTSSPSSLELVPSGTDGLAFKEPDMGLACDSKLDGKDYPCSGPTLPPGWTVAMTKAGPRSLDLLVKKDAKPFFKVTYTVAADGKSMTEVDGATATNEKVKIVYDRQ
jgi:hypothetical protein